jgi:protoporphyrin/coproporphyrin ferrochelatase
MGHDRAVEVAVLLMALGGPDSLEAVEPYLLDLRGGRPTPPELVEEIRERYAATGGRSPVLDITRELGRRLESIRPVKVFVGLRHWRPGIADAWREIVEAKPGRVVAICMAPQYSAMTVGKYWEKLDEAIATVGGADLALSRVRSWATHPGLIDAFAEAVTKGLHGLPPKTPVLFTAHSLPERIVTEGDPYPAEVWATVEAVTARLRLPVTTFAYQSQGRSAEPWIGPEVEHTLEGLAAEGHRHVLVAPIGFLSDHVEITYDIDIEFKGVAQELGMELRRTPMLNAGDPLAATLAALVDEEIRSSRLEASSG